MVVAILLFCLFLACFSYLITLIVKLITRVVIGKEIKKNIEGYHAALEYNKVLNKILREQEQELKDQINFISHIDSTLNELGIPKQSENE